MRCCHADFALVEGSDRGFTVGMPTFTFGPGVLAEAGDNARELGLTRVALFTDARLVAGEHVAKVRASLAAAGVDVAVYDAVAIEPTDASFQDAARFAAGGRFDGYVSVGGGSVMDTCKAANLYATHPAEFMTYVNAPIGDGRQRARRRSSRTSRARRPRAPARRRPASRSSRCARSTRRPASSRGG